MKRLSSKIIVSVSLALFLILFSSCDTTESNVTSLSLSFASKTTLPKVNADNFQIQEVKLLLRNIKLKNQANEDSEQVKAGPFVINLSLNGEVTEFASSEIPPGNYDRVRFEIHKLEDSDVVPDLEFKEGTESSQRYSAIVKGTLDGNTFTYKFQKSAEQDIKLDEDIVVGEGEAANLTLIVDPKSWFYEGDILLNPNDQANESKIEQRMKEGFKRALKDNNHDGLND